MSPRSLDIVWGVKKIGRPRPLDRVPVGPSQIRKLGNQCQDTSGLERDQARGKGLFDPYEAFSHLPDFADRSTASTTLSVCMAPSKVGSAGFFSSIEFKKSAT